MRNVHFYFALYCRWYFPNTVHTDKVESIYWGKIAKMLPIIIIMGQYLGPYMKGMTSKVRGNSLSVVRMEFYEKISYRQLHLEQACRYPAGIISGNFM